MHILFCSHSYHQSLVSGGTIKMIPSLITVILTLVLLAPDAAVSQQSLSPYYPTSLSASALLTLGGADFLPEDSVTAVGLKQQLIRRYHYLEYVKSVYQQLKKEYTRCAFNTSKQFASFGIQFRHYYDYATLVSGYNQDLGLLGLSGLGGLGPGLGGRQRQAKDQNLNTNEETELMDKTAISIIRGNSRQ